MIETSEQSGIESGVTLWLNRIQAEYREMPGLSLTQAQMQRLWGLEADTCEALIASLIDARVLRRTVTGHFIAYDS